MDPTFRRVQLGLPSVGCAASGSVCNNLISVCVCLAGYMSVERGHFCLSQGGVGSICLSFLLSDALVAGLDQKVFWHSRDVDCPRRGWAECFLLLLDLLVDHPQFYDFHKSPEVFTFTHGALQHLFRKRGFFVEVC